MKRKLAKNWKCKIVALILLSFATALSFNQVASATLVGKGINHLDSSEFLEMAVATALSPGIAILKIAYRAKSEGIEVSTADLLGFWLLAGIDFLTDKIPGLASLIQIFVHPVIWIAAFKGATILGGSPSMWLFAAFMGSILLVAKQIYTLVLDAQTVGITTPFRGLIEDLLAWNILD
jgi:hypothetical protein